MELTKACKQLIITDPFYGLFLLNLKKAYSNEVSTLGVGLNNLDCELLVNKEFWDSLSDKTQIACVKHELGHILMHHLTMRESFNDQEKCNIAMDIEINQYLQDLPETCYFPETFGFPKEKGTKWYYDNLPSVPKEGTDGIGDHSQWQPFEDLSEVEKQLVSQQIDHIAKHTAEQVQKLAGKIPGEFEEYIKGLFQKKPPIYNWKKHFRRVVGNSITSEIQLTRMRPSKRFPDARGIKLKRKPQILVGIDTSGSVSQEDLSDFFTEIQHMYKTGVDITVAECDTKIQKIFKYTGPKEIPIAGRGGTQLHELYSYYKEHKEFSSMVILTDGCLFDFNFPPMKNVIWIITHDGNKSQRFPGIQINIPNK